MLFVCLFVGDEVDIFDDGLPLLIYFISSFQIQSPQINSAGLDHFSAGVCDAHQLPTTHHHEDFFHC